MAKYFGDRKDLHDKLQVLPSASDSGFETVFSDSFSGSGSSIYSPFSGSPSFSGSFTFDQYEYTGFDRFVDTITKAPFGPSYSEGFEEEPDWCEREEESLLSGSVISQDPGLPSILPQASSVTFDIDSPRPEWLRRKIKERVAARVAELEDRILKNDDYRRRLRVSGDDERRSTVRIGRSGRRGDAGKGRMMTEQERKMVDRMANQKAKQILKEKLIAQALERSKTMQQKRRNDHRHSRRERKSSEDEVEIVFNDQSESWGVDKLWNGLRLWEVPTDTRQSKDFDAQQRSTSRQKSRQTPPPLNDGANYVHPLIPANTRQRSRTSTRRDNKRQPENRQTEKTTRASITQISSSRDQPEGKISAIIPDGTERSEASQEATAHNDFNLQNPAQIAAERESAASFKRRGLHLNLHLSSGKKEKGEKENTPMSKRSATGNLLRKTKSTDTTALQSAQKSQKSSIAQVKNFFRDKVRPVKTEPAGDECEDIEIITEESQAKTKTSGVDVSDSDQTTSDHPCDMAADQSARNLPPLTQIKQDAKVAIARLPSLYTADGQKIRVEVCSPQPTAILNLRAVTCDDEILTESEYDKKTSNKSTKHEDSMTIRRRLFGGVPSSQKGLTKSASFALGKARPLGRRMRSESADLHKTQGELTINRRPSEDLIPTPLPTTSESRGKRTEHRRTTTCGSLSANSLVVSANGSTSSKSRSSNDKPAETMERGVNKIATTLEAHSSQEEMVVPGTCSETGPLGQLHHVLLHGNEQGTTTALQELLDNPCHEVMIFPTEVETLAFGTNPARETIVGGAGDTGSGGSDEELELTTPGVEVALVQPTKTDRKNLAKQLISHLPHPFSNLQQQKSLSAEILVSKGESGDETATYCSSGLSNDGTKDADGQTAGLDELPQMTETESKPVSVPPAELSRNLSYSTNPHRSLKDKEIAVIKRSRSVSPSRNGPRKTKKQLKMKKWFVKQDGKKTVSTKEPLPKHDTKALFESTPKFAPFGLRRNRTLDPLPRSCRSLALSVGDMSRPSILRTSTSIGRHHCDSESRCSNKVQFADLKNSHSSNRGHTSRQVTKKDVHASSSDHKAQLKKQPAKFQLSDGKDEEAKATHDDIPSFLLEQGEVDGNLKMAKSSGSKSRKESKEGVSSKEPKDLDTNDGEKEILKKIKSHLRKKLIHKDAFSEFMENRRKANDKRKMTKMLHDILKEIDHSEESIEDVMGLVEDEVAEMYALKCHRKKVKREEFDRRILRAVQRNAEQIAYATLKEQRRHRRPRIESSFLDFLACNCSANDVLPTPRATRC